jgi:hypothetical protein
MDRSHRLGAPHKTNLAGSVNDPLMVRLVCTKIPYQSIYGIVLPNCIVFYETSGGMFKKYFWGGWRLILRSKAQGV